MYLPRSIHWKIQTLSCLCSFGCVALLVLLVHTFPFTLSEILKNYKSIVYTMKSVSLMLFYIFLSISIFQYLLTSLACLSHSASSQFVPTESLNTVKKNIYRFTFSEFVGEYFQDSVCEVTYGAQVYRHSKTCQCKSVFLATQTILLVRIIHYCFWSFLWGL